MTDSNFNVHDFSQICVCLYTNGATADKLCGHLKGSILPCRLDEDKKLEIEKIYWLDRRREAQEISHRRDQERQKEKERQARERETTQQ